jgi:hypothetical protein
VAVSACSCSAHHEPRASACATRPEPEMVLLVLPEMVLPEPELVLLVLLVARRA